jgi:nitroreductase
MDFYELVHKRRMVRNFTTDPIDPAALERILEAAQHGPSAGFTQGQDLIVVTDPATRKQLADLCDEPYYVNEMGLDPFISKPPLIIVPCTSERAYLLRYREPDKMNDPEGELDWPVPFWFMDGGCAVMLILLAVVQEGLAAGFAGFQDLDGARAVLGIPPEVTPLGVIPIGHPALDKKSPSLKRGRRANAVHRERW